MYKTFEIIKKEMFFISMLMCVIFFTIASVNYYFEIQDREKQKIDDIALKQQKIEREQEKNRPIEEYIEYYSVLPENDVVKIWDPLYWYSNWIVKEPIDRTYQEVLKCDEYDWQWFRYFSYFESKSTTTESELWLMDSPPWRWGWTTPQVPAECFIDSDIKVTTEAGDVKPLSVESKTVKIIQ